jgi:hypothetical protein
MVFRGADDTRLRYNRFLALRRASRKSRKEPDYAEGFP